MKIPKGSYDNVMALNVDVIEEARDCLRADHLDAIADILDKVIRSLTTAKIETMLQGAS